MEREEHTDQWGRIRAAGRDQPQVRPAERRLLELMDEFTRRQHVCPDLVVRFWFASAAEEPRGRRPVGFVVEYCPRGVDSAELAVRLDRVRAEAPGGVREVSLNLADGWRLDGHDRQCPETLASHLLRMADQLLATPRSTESIGAS